MNFNEKLISLRRSKGLSQEQLANLIDVSRQAVSKWETAESLPDLAKLILMSNVFEVSLDELCGKKSESTAALPIASSKQRIRIVWLCAAALVIGLAIGLAGGFFTAGVFFPKASQQLIKNGIPEASPQRTENVTTQAPQQQIENISITSFSIYPELYDKKILLVYSPSIAKDTFSYKVLKTDSDGNVTSFPATYAEGVCKCTVIVDGLYGGFTLNSVISDGAYEYSSGLAKISTLSENGFGYEELWNK